MHLGGAPVVVSNNIASDNRSDKFFSRSGAGLACLGPDPVDFRCNVLWQNDVDVIVDCVGDSASSRTIVADPMFCAGPAAQNFGPYSLDPRSPATSPQSGNCGHIGALPIECRVTSVTNTDWTRIKLLFR